MARKKRTLTELHKAKIGRKRRAWWQANPQARKEASERMRGERNPNFGGITPERRRALSQARMGDNNPMKRQAAVRLAKHIPEIVALAREGLTDRQIGHRIGQSPTYICLHKRSNPDLAKRMADARNLATVVKR